LSISITQKNKYLLEPLIKLYGGRIIILKSKEAFQYTIYKKNEILNLIDGYFKFYPLKSGKAARLYLIKDFFELNKYRNLSIKNVKFNQ
jgi:hypothetical protein